MSSLPCKICSSAADSFVDESTQKIYYHCSNCEFIFLDPAGIISEVKERERYTKHENSLENEGYVRMHSAFIDQLKPYISAKLDIALDFGCGSVPVLAHLLQETGVAKQVNVYDKFFYPDFVLQADTYDLITCTEVLEHLDKPLKYFALFKQLLKSTGQLAITTYLHTNSCIDFTRWWYKNDITHIAFFSKQTLHWLASYFSFKLVFLNEKNSALFIKS